MRDSGIKGLSENRGDAAAAELRLRTGRRVLLGLIFAGLVALCGWQFIRSAVLQIHVAFAEDQTQMISEFLENAQKETRPERVTIWLEQMVNYYPSGTKQVAGSRLDRVVERVRSGAVTEILSRLRSITGQDLGSDAAKWLTAYPPSH